MSANLDEAIRQRGKAFFASIRGESASIFNKGFWTGKVMTRRCNLKCVHCYAQAVEVDGTDDISTAQAKTMIITYFTETILREGLAR